MIITYGLENRNVDVTDICKIKLLKNGYITIPPNDIVRARFMPDPLPGIVKYIFIEDDNNIITKYDESKTIYIDISSNFISDIIPDALKPYDVNYRLEQIHSNTILHYGGFNDELPEQKMVVSYLKGNEKVLEIGGNIGRNSLVIASILGKVNQANLVVLESHSDICEKLIENRDLNNMKFKIENSALSKRNLIQKGWITKVSDVMLDGYTKVNTITYEELQEKYKIDFDTLVIDCEGAFYYILVDMPEILKNINLFIIENDYATMEQKKYVDSVLTANQFELDYREPGGCGECLDMFYEVWIKSSTLK